MSDDKLTLRVSSLDGHADCMARGLATSLRSVVQDQGYDLKEGNKGIGAMVGNACHASASMDLNAIKLGIDRPSQNETDDLAIESFKDEVQDAQIVFDDLTPNHNEAHRQILAISRTHYNKVAPLSDPVLVEKRLFCQVGDRVILSGQPDSIERSGGIDDIKTGRQCSHLLQFGGYGVLAESNDLTVTGGRVIGLPRPKKNQTVQMYNDIIPEDILHHGAMPAVFEIIDRITENYDKVLAGDPVYAVNPASMMCSRKMCPAHGTAFCVATYKQ